MKKIAKLFCVVAVAAAAYTFFSLNSSNEIICGNIEALTGGDNGGGPSMPDRWVYMSGGVGQVADADLGGGYYDPDLVYDEDKPIPQTPGNCRWSCDLYIKVGKCVTITYSYQDYLNEL